MMDLCGAAAPGPLKKTLKVSPILHEIRDVDYSIKCHNFLRSLFFGTKKVSFCFEAGY